MNSARTSQSSYHSRFFLWRKALVSLLVILLGVPLLESVAQKDKKEGSDGERMILPSSTQSDPDARLLQVGIPAPRGVIVDRYGRPFAQSKVVNYVAVKIKKFDNSDPIEIINFARERIDAVEKMLAKDYGVTDERILKHYENRRWLPLILSAFTLSPNQASAVKGIKLSGITLVPTYERVYPQGATAPHIIGYSGLKGGFPAGEIHDGDPMWPESLGREGLEKSLNEELTGTNGSYEYLFDADGSILTEELTKSPVPGKTVVLTLDLGMQKLAESTVRYRAPRGGAMVVVSVRTGEIMAMASYPLFDPNDFIPKIKADKWDALRDHKYKAIFGRAFQGEYPPASCFKPISALAALESGKVTPSTKYNCPPYFKIGSRKFHNHSKYHQGRLNVVSALMLSNNVWFYQAAIATGTTHLISMTHRFGFGADVGIMLPEKSGFVPTDEWSMKERERTLKYGDLANLAIGQGDLLATPLQVAQAMAGVANGIEIPKARLVKQIQDINGNVIQQFPYQARNALNLNPADLKSIRQGMINVVHASSGTGKKGANGYYTVAAKTGTAQWGAGKNLAWFAGFLPAGNPEFAFACVYEGVKGEGGISGGGKAAPMAASFFSRHYRYRKSSGSAPDAYARYASKSYSSSDTPTRASSSSSSKKKKKSTSSSRKKSSSSSRKKSTASTKKKSSSSSTRAAKPIPKTSATKARETVKKDSGVKKFWNRIRGRK